MFLRWLKWTNVKFTFRRLSSIDDCSILAENESELRQATSAAPYCIQTYSKCWLLWVAVVTHKLFIRRIDRDRHASMLSQCCGNGIGLFLHTCSFILSLSTTHIHNRELFICVKHAFWKQKQHASLHDRSSVGLFHWRSSKQYLTLKY